jgi:hypothetical protein
MAIADRADRVFRMDNGQIISSKVNKKETKE